MEVVRLNSHVPGTRIIKEQLAQRFNLTISRKKVTSLVREMKLMANRPRKDAYKGKATYFHQFLSMPNHVNQQFINNGARRVILTDITYSYYGENRELFYVCVFKDGFTNEILGFQQSKTMDVTLIIDAYTSMMEKHRHEFDFNQHVYIHSDQGSQYLSLQYIDLLKKDGFVQSMSSRGNSQDNSSVESFFARYKHESQTIVALCKTYETATTMVSNYAHYYNNERIQLDLAGLTPHNYYLYVMTGIYPLDTYYGVSSSELRTQEEVIHYELQRRLKKKSKKKRKSTNDKITTSGPYQAMMDDYKKLSNYIRAQEKIVDNKLGYIDKMKETLTKIEEAKQFYCEATEVIKEELKNVINWRNYPAMSYINSMPALY